MAASQPLVINAALCGNEIATIVIMEISAKIVRLSSTYQAFCLAIFMSIIWSRARPVNTICISLCACISYNKIENERIKIRDRRPKWPGGG
jgi:hypothetical protein